MQMTHGCQNWPLAQPSTAWLLKQYLALERRQESFQQAASQIMTHQLSSESLNFCSWVVMENGYQIGEEHLSASSDANGCI